MVELGTGVLVLFASSVARGLVVAIKGLRARVVEFYIGILVLVARSLDRGLVVAIRGVRARIVVAGDLRILGAYYCLSKLYIEDLRGY